MIKALSLKQPYASLIVEGKKTIELRRWNTTFRGEFLVHAAKTPMIDDCKRFGYDHKTIVTGAILGKATVKDVIHYENIYQWKGDRGQHLAGDEFNSSMYGFILTDPVKFREPIPYKGQLNFFRVNLDLTNYEINSYLTTSTR